MRFFKPLLLVFLLTAAVQAQIGPEQSSKDQTSKNTWEQREAQTKALKKELARNPNSAEANYRLAKAYLREPILGTKDAIKYFQQA